ncbi:NDR1/HIN1-like protein 13 [Eucalyptus grandis]|uniref:NDR1/HIN1-like protein 13 n=1 Tax=Eucalyptus grandis TaxID=71139 RepID=UPI00192E99D4|nr:NDR1/HIN1-like protein 13 [Eucalyptus grandis]
MVTSSNPATPVQHAHQPPPPPLPPRSIHEVVRRLIASLVLLFVSVSTACFVAWLVLRPHPPAFEVNSLAVSGLNISSPDFGPRSDLELAIMNPNRKIVFFIDHFGLLVTYRGIPLLRRVKKPTYRVEIPGNGSFRVKLELDTGGLNDERERAVLGDMKGEWSKGAVSFEAKAKVRVKFIAWGWLSRERLVEASCQDLSVEFSPGEETGKLRDGGRICSVE